MRRLIYQVYVGERAPLYDRCIATVAAYCERHGFEHRVQTEPILRIQPSDKSHRSEAALRLGYLPIYEKENALGLLGAEVDQVAIVDADVWVRDGSPSVFDELEPGMDIAVVKERSAPITPEYARKLDHYERGQYAPLGGIGMPFANMGVMVCDASLRRLCPEEPRDFLALPEFQRFIDGIGGWRWSTDQTLLNWWLASSRAHVQALDWRWNALYGALVDGAVDEAHFVHFFLRGHLTSDDPAVLLATRGRKRV